MLHYCQFYQNWNAEGGQHCFVWLPTELQLNQHSQIRLAPLKCEAEGLSNHPPVCCVKLRLFSFEVLLSFTGHSLGSNGGPVSG